MHVEGASHGNRRVGLYDGGAAVGGSEGGCASWAVVWVIRIRVDVAGADELAGEALLEIAGGGEVDPDDPPELAL